MPAPQLHLTFGDMVQHNAGVPSEMRKACAAEPAYARFGSIFHDLPYYYAPMVFEAVRYGLGAPPSTSPGDIGSTQCDPIAWWPASCASCAPPPS